jgi:hypothetical protein
MSELKSEQLAQLVSLGGWARGVEALSVLVSQRYSPENAELLRQPMLLSHFEQQLAAMAKDDPVVANAMKSLQDYRRILEATQLPIQAPTVKDIGGVAAELLSSAAAETRETR